MGPPPQQSVGAPIPPPPPPPLPAQHPHAMYHPQHRSQQQPQQQQQQHPNGYQQGYPPHSQSSGMNRYGPPPMHSSSQQHQHVRPHHPHHHPNHSTASSNFRHPPVPHGGGRHPISGNPGHHHYHPHAVVMVPGATHGMGPMQPQHHHRHQYPPRPFHGHPPPAVVQPNIHPPYSTRVKNLPTRSLSYSSASALNAKSNEPAISSDSAPHNELSSLTSKRDSSSTKDVGGASNDAVASMTKESDFLDSAKTSNFNGAVHTNSPTPTAVSFRDCIDQANRKTVSSSNILTESKPSNRENRNAFTVMSPITMCFDRMLGAAEAIKTPGSATLSKKRGPLSKKVLPLSASMSTIRNKRKSIDNELNPFDEILEDPDLERLVILQMAMQRNQHFQTVGDGPRCDSLPPLPQPPKREVSRIIKEGFFWREYPACEQVLYNHMHKYYEISAIQKNYKVQQYFNNVLVEEVRQAAKDSGFTVDPEFCDKMLRDRIRCFYKTHLQNAKKRLATLMKHADSFENQCLVAVFIRCVRNPDLSFEDSLAMANTATECFEDSLALANTVTEFDQENMESGTHMNTMPPSTKKFKLDSIDEKLNAIATECIASMSDDTSSYIAPKEISMSHSVGPM